MHEELRAALAGLLDGLPPRRAAQAVERLMTHYRGRTPTDAPVLRDRADAVAYAAYRMPATFEAVHAALAAVARRAPDWTPTGHIDVGGGTGAATWAAADVWPEVRTTVLDWAEPALELGRELAAGTLPDVRWHRQAVGAGLALPAGTDLVTVSYVLGELRESDRHTLVDEAARAATTVVVVEPGTPEGFRRIRAARDRLLAAGLHVLAPCPHSAACPMPEEADPARGGDWCHFAARVSRSALHRRVKQGSLAYEDEKYAYVAATRADRPAAAARVVRRPQQPKGQVLLDLCTPEGLTRTTVTKRHGERYRTARNLAWGAEWDTSPGD
ncbi:small ribosomal subunit Rsm22 family protein [Streptomyces sp. NPDC059740]|uniref:small ribosomal subunit Rsm22 family protein n=1 Tax=Streptomyces sp. NPDC059740 TaxID=3346926 RepID=UPI003662F60E